MSLLERATQIGLMFRRRLPSSDWVKSFLRKRLIIIVVVVGVVFSLLWYFVVPWRPHLVPIGTALGALFGAIPGLIAEHTRGRWIPATLGSIFVGLVTWYTTMNLETELDHKRSELESKSRLEQDVLDLVRQLPESQKQALILQAYRKLALEYDTNVLKKMSQQRSYEHVDDLIRFLLAINRGNGHALYFAGQANRARKRWDSYQDDWFRYLENEQALPQDSVERGGSTSVSVCEKSPAGYCRQRTGWIQHLLANDFYSKGRQETDRNKRREAFKVALKYVKAALVSFPEGFRGSGQGIPTTDLKLILENELQNLASSTD